MVGSKKTAVKLTLPGPSEKEYKTSKGSVN